MKVIVRPEAANVTGADLLLEAAFVQQPGVHVGRFRCGRVLGGFVRRRCEQTVTVGRKTMFLHYCVLLPIVKPPQGQTGCNPFRKTR